MLLFHIPVEKMREAAAAWRAADRGRNGDLHDKVDDLIAEVDSLRRDRTAVQGICKKWDDNDLGDYDALASIEMVLDGAVKRSAP